MDSEGMEFGDMDPETLRVVLEIQLQDLESIVDGNDEPTDMALAVNSYKAELRALAQGSGNADASGQTFTRLQTTLATAAANQQINSASQTNKSDAQAGDKRKATEPAPTEPQPSKPCLGTSNASRGTDDEGDQQPKPQVKTGARVEAPTLTPTQPFASWASGPGFRLGHQLTRNGNLPRPHHNPLDESRSTANEPPLQPRLGQLNANPFLTRDETQTQDAQPAPAPAHPVNRMWRTPSIFEARPFGEPAEGPNPTVTSSGKIIQQTPGPSSSLPKPSAQLPPRPPQKTCPICTGSHDATDFVMLRCDHEYCRQCLQRLFEESINDEARFPPRCCSKPILLDQVRHHLPREVTDTFEAKAIEYATPNRIYCHVPTCSTFIPVERCGKCPACDERTCVVCKNAAHLGKPCGPDEAMEQLRQLARDNGWQACYSCSRLVELETGCNHMTCKCKAEFCYECGRQWKTCDCPQWEEGRLLARADEMVNRIPEAAAMAADRREAVVQQQVEYIRGNYACVHEGWMRVRARRQWMYTCEECNMALPWFVYECRACHTQLCLPCRNRLYD